MEYVYEADARVLSWDGQQLAVIEDFLALGFTKKLNDWGKATIPLPHGHRLAAFSSIRHLDILQIRWSALRYGIPFDVDWTGLVYEPHIKTPDSVYPRNTWTACEPEILLSEVKIWYPADTANKTLFEGVPTETIIKTLVAQNLSIATGATAANGRLMDSKDIPLVIAPDLGRGVVPDGKWECHDKTLLGEVQALCLLGDNADVNLTVPADFSLTLERNTDGSFYFLFEYHECLGVDRSSGADARAQFDIDNGNMQKPTYYGRRIGTSNVAIGKAEDADGNAVYGMPVYTPDYEPRAHREIMVSTDLETSNPADLTGETLAELLQHRATDEFDFGVVQSEGFHYRRHYGLGDKLPAVLRDKNGMLANTVQKVTSVQFLFKDSSQPAKFKIDMDYLTADQYERAYQQSQQFNRRLENLER